MFTAINKDKAEINWEWGNVLYLTKHTDGTAMKGIFNLFSMSHDGRLLFIGFCDLYTGYMNNTIASLYTRGDFISIYNDNPSVSTGIRDSYNRSIQCQLTQCSSTTQYLNKSLKCLQFIPQQFGNTYLYYHRIFIIVAEYFEMPFCFDSFSNDDDDDAHYAK